MYCILCALAPGKITKGTSSTPDSSYQAENAALTPSHVQAPCSQWSEGTATCSKVVCCVLSFILALWFFAKLNRYFGDGAQGFLGCVLSAICPCCCTPAKPTSTTMHTSGRTTSPQSYSSIWADFRRVLLAQAEDGAERTQASGTAVSRPLAVENPFVCQDLEVQASRAMAVFSQPGDPLKGVSTLATKRLAAANRVVGTLCCLQLSGRQVHNPFTLQWHA